MENKQQTAVEWLVENAEDFFGNLLSPSITDKALQMEREQIEQAYRVGVEEDVYNNPLRTGTDYFNDTYGTPKSH